MAANLPVRLHLWEKIMGLLLNLVGILLGSAFFYTGLIKHFHPYEFAQALLGYQLLPPSLVGVVAAILPWSELFPGFLLALGYGAELVGSLAVGLGLAGGAYLLGGIKRRSCLLLLTALSGLFLLVILFTMARGLKIDCGCGLFSHRQVGPRAALEDLLFLLASAGLYWREARTGEG